MNRTRVKSKNRQKSSVSSTKQAAIPRPTSSYSTITSISTKTHSTQSSRPISTQTRKISPTSSSTHQRQAVSSRKVISRSFSSLETSLNTNSSSTQPAIGPQDVMDAYDRIKGTIRRSPLQISQPFSDLTGCKVFLKKEHSTSQTGSYKERGALNKLLSLTEEQRKRGVICSSAGNHAQAVSLHSTRLGIDGVIVMPNTTPHIKVQKTASFGATVVQHGDSFSDAYSFAKQLCDYENRTFIHAFDDPYICAGAGTVAIEMIEQNPFLDAVIVPVGGGGLIAGMSALIKNVNPRIKVYGVEAVAMPGMLKSLKEGHVTSVPKESTMADGIAIETVGQVPFNIIKRYVDDIVTVSEDDLAQSVLQLLELEKTVVEASGAAGITALMSNKFSDLKGKQVGVVVTGSNIDMTLLGRIINKGLVRSGRLARISVTIRDIPGQLARICNICQELGVNIKEIKHERAFLLETVGMTQPVLDIETKGFDHIEKLMERMKEEQFIDCHVVTSHH